jgi:hypothetical protein
MRVLRDQLHETLRCTGEERGVSLQWDERELAHRAAAQAAADTADLLRERLADLEVDDAAMVRLGVERRLQLKAVSDHVASEIGRSRASATVSPWRCIVKRNGGSTMSRPTGSSPTPASVRMPLISVTALRIRPASGATGARKPWKPARQFSCGSHGEYSS